MQAGLRFSRFSDTLKKGEPRRFPFVICRSDQLRGLAAGLGRYFLTRRQLCRADDTLIRIDGAQVFDYFENAIACLGNVHVHAGVMLSGDHFSGTAGAR